MMFVLVEILERAFNLGNCILVDDLCLRQIAEIHERADCNNNISKIRLGAKEAERSKALISIIKRSKQRSTF
jgi:hypothetical protein